MPTDALTRLDQVMRETKEYGFEKVRQGQIELGAKVRNLLERRGFMSVAAAGVPLQCDEPADFSTFRIGLFGLDKLYNPDRSVAQLAATLDKMGYTEKVAATA